MSDVLVLDTYSLFFRAFFALPAMSTSEGEPTNAVYGLATLLLKLLREREPCGLAFAIDAPARTFRHEAYDDYKGHRVRMPSELAVQLGRLDELVEAIGAPSFCVPGFEADDAIASLCTQLERDGLSSLVVSGDRDLLQLAGERTRVLFVGARGREPKLFGASDVLERFGVPPERLPSYVALVGDTSDNLPKVPGVGPGTARRLLAAHHDARALLEHLDSVSPPRLRDALGGHAEQILHVEELARLRRDVPLDGPPWYGVLDRDAFARLRELFDDLEFKSLHARLAQLEARILDGAAPS